MPGPERRGEEAALAGTDQRALGDRLAGGDLVADDGADQALRIDAAFAADEIGVLDQALRPGLVAEGLGVDDRADRQGAGRDQHFGAGRDDRAGLRPAARAAPVNMFLAMTAVTPR